jgi:hypothetical protein
VLAASKFLLPEDTALGNMHVAVAGVLVLTGLASLAFGVLTMLQVKHVSTSGPVAGRTPTAGEPRPPEALARLSGAWRPVVVRRVGFTSPRPANDPLRSRRAPGPAPSTAQPQPTGPVALVH